MTALTNRVALVTGASMGIGAGLAVMLAAEGARVVLAARRRDELEQVAKDIRRDGGTAVPVVTDLTDDDSLARLLATTRAELGAVDVLVNNAGYAIWKPLEATTITEWDHTFAVNVRAAAYLCGAVLPGMQARGFGRIINIASLQSVRAFADSGPYGASKGGVMQLTRAQAQAWSVKGVNANAIAPGFFRTPLTAPVAADPVLWERNAARTFIGRNGEMPDLAGTAIFLASRASNYVTGQTIFVDGGFSAG